MKLGDSYLITIQYIKYVFTISFLSISFEFDFDLIRPDVEF